MNIFKNKMLLIADVFPKLRIPKNLVKQISKTLPLRGPFDKRHAKWYQTLLKFERHHLYHIYWSVSRQLSRKKCLLVRSKFLRLFLYTFIGNDKYSLLDRDNLRQLIQMQLSRTQITFLEFVSAFLNARLNSELFP